VPRSPRQRLGIVMLVAGLATIVGAVLYVLEAADGPGPNPHTFAERRSYDQVKVEVHRTFPYALLVGLGGLALAMLGKRWMGGGEEQA